MTDERQPSPFAVLGISPTLEARDIRRAYFALLERFPPQQDPEGFARLRQAYERLTDPASLTMTFLAEPVDAKGEIATREARRDPAHKEGAGRLAAERQDAQTLERFVEVFSRRRLEDAAGCT